MSRPFPSKLSMKCTLVQLREEATFRRLNLGNVPLTKSQLLGILGDGSASSKAAAERKVSEKTTPAFQARKTTSVGQARKYTAGPVKQLPTKCARKACRRQLVDLSKAKRDDEVARKQVQETLWYYG